MVKALLPTYLASKLKALGKKGSRPKSNQIKEKIVARKLSGESDTTSENIL